MAAETADSGDAFDTIERAVTSDTTEATDAVETPACLPLVKIDEIKGEVRERSQSIFSD